VILSVTHSFMGITSREITRVLSYIFISLIQHIKVINIERRDRQDLHNQQKRDERCVSFKILF